MTFLLGTLWEAPFYTIHLHLSAPHTCDWALGPETSVDNDHFCTLKTLVRLLQLEESFDSIKWQAKGNEGMAIKSPLSDHHYHMPLGEVRKMGRIKGAGKAAARCYRPAAIQ